MRNREHFEQTALIHWWGFEAMRRGLDPRLLVAVPNGGRRNIGTARKLKAEGVRAGIPDLILLTPKQGYHGLFIELKAPVKTARVSPAQKEMMKVLGDQGYVCRVCYGWGEARDAIDGYLGK